MNKKLKHYIVLAELFRYPEEGFLNKVLACTYIIDKNYKDSLQFMDQFISHVKVRSTEELQEYFIKTFDVKSVCFLDIGYVIYGEDYKRGEFLVHIQREQKNAGNDCGVELADHLPNLLTLLPKVADSNFADELSYSMIIPALNELVKDFPSDNMYKNCLELLVKVMEEDFKDLSYEKVVINAEQETGVLKNYCGGCKISSKKIKI